MHTRFTGAAHLNLHSTLSPRLLAELNLVCIAAMTLHALTSCPSILPAP